MKNFMKYLTAMVVIGTLVIALGMGTLDTVHMNYRVLRAEADEDSTTVDLTDGGVVGAVVPLQEFAVAQVRVPIPAQDERAHRSGEGLEIVHVHLLRQGDVHVVIHMAPGLGDLIRRMRTVV